MRGSCCSLLGALEGHPVGYPVRMPTDPLRLILMRHAKSAWDTDAPTDHARPLNGRGRRDAPRIARALVELGWSPDAVLSSDSARTRETFARMRPELEPLEDARVHFDRALYHAGATELAETLPRLDGLGARVALTLGHNPGWEEALEWLSGAEEVMKTATAALLEAEVPASRTSPDRAWDWAVGAPGRFELVEILYPRELA